MPERSDHGVQYGCDPEWHHGQRFQADYFLTYRAPRQNTDPVISISYFHRDDLSRATCSQHLALALRLLVAEARRTQPRNDLMIMVRTL